MKFIVALVINLIVFVQFSKSHTIKPTVIVATSEPDSDDGVAQVNEDDNAVPETNPYINWYAIDEAHTKTEAPDSKPTTEKPDSKPTTEKPDPKSTTKEPDSKSTTEEPPNEDELVFAHVMYRHGERDIPKHIELTNEGKMRLFELGQYFHKRYGKLIGKGYQPDKVFVMSTDHDRAIMSAQANLAGMFEPNDTEKWHEHILWQPVPVHTLPTVLDNILRPRYEDRCPRYDKMYNWYIKKSPEAKAMYKKYGKYFEFWAKQTGKKVKHVEHVFSIYKKFLSQIQQNETIPEWAEKACAPDGPFKEIADVVYALRAKPDLVRIRSGFLLKEMLERFKAKRNEELEPDLALYMYSAHSSTISTLLNGLGFNLPIPEHGFSFHFEMYKTFDGKYYLQLYLRQPGDENPKPEKIKKCGKKCSLKDFYKIYDELIPGEFEVECGVKKPKKDKPEEPEKPEGDKTPKPPTNGHNAAATIENSRTFSIILCSLWLIRKFIS